MSQRKPTRAALRRMTEHVIDGPTGNPKADRKRAHRKKKHAIINEKIKELRGKYTGMTAAQRASEARQYADCVLSEQRRQAEVLNA
jgi:hypothetical protein